MPFTSAMSRPRTAESNLSIATLTGKEKKKMPAIPLRKDAMSALPQPPPVSGTPTRRLLQRIQRRSSTSAESMLTSASAVPRRMANTTISGAYAATQLPSTLPPISAQVRSTVRKANDATIKPALRRRDSSSSLYAPTSYGLRTRKPSDASVALHSTQQQQTLKGTDKQVIQVDEYGSFLPMSSSTATYEVLDDARIKLPGYDLSSDDSERKKSITEKTMAAAEIDSKKCCSSNVTPMTVSSPQFGSTSASKKALDAAQKGNGSAAPSANRSALLRQAGQGGQSLTHEAAIALEQEFTQQERILQGLQRDNESKTIEIGEVRRHNARLEEFLARYFGQEHWREIVFGPGGASGGSAKGTAAKDTPCTLSKEQERSGYDLPFLSPSTTVQSTTLDTSITSSALSLLSKSDKDAVPHVHQSSEGLSESDLISPEPISPSQQIVENLLRTLSSCPSSPLSPSVERKAMKSATAKHSVLPRSVSKTQQQHGRSALKSLPTNATAYASTLPLHKIQGISDTTLDSVDHSFMSARMGSSPVKPMVGSIEAIDTTSRLQDREGFELLLVRRDALQTLADAHSVLLKALTPQL